MSRYKILTLLIISFFIVLPAKAEVLDSDNDGLDDAAEVNIYHTDPQLADTDGDGYLDGAEIAQGFSPLQANKKLKEVDTDGDGLNDAQELVLGTDLGNPDTDNDGYFDGLEVTNGFDPLQTGAVKMEKRIEVSLAKQQLSYFFGDKKLDEFLISSGVTGLRTKKENLRFCKKGP